MSEWWRTIGQPFVEAVLSFDTTRIREALYNLPHTYYEYIHTLFLRSPEHVIIETFLICFIMYITFVKTDSPDKPLVKLTEKEIQELCDEWKPEPLVPISYLTKHSKPSKPFAIVEEKLPGKMRLQNIKNPVLDLASFDFLGFSTRSEIAMQAKIALTKYGCGSCGPRGFYGTIDTHVKLEKDLAAKLGTPDCAIFSDSETTCTSVLPTFAKRGHLIVVDEGCNDSILVGATLARCNAFFYKHNDMEDLERVLKSIRETDRKNNRKSDCQRRFIVTEAIFRNYGDMIHLPTILSLCEKYYFRLFLDESFSFGVLGSTGKGITEHFGVDVSAVDVLCSSLSSSTASVGGFCAGTEEVVEHQRFTSAGYVFSASAPPFTSACASVALDIMNKEPELFVKLQHNIALVHDTLAAEVSALNGERMEIAASRRSPILHIRISKNTLSSIVGDNDEKQRELSMKVCESIMNQCLYRGIAVAAPRYKLNQTHMPAPSIRISISAIHSSEQLEDACKVIASEWVNATSNLANF